MFFVSITTSFIPILDMVYNSDLSYLMTNYFVKPEKISRKIYLKTLRYFLRPNAIQTSDNDLSPFIDKSLCLWFQTDSIKIKIRKDVRLLNHWVTDRPKICGNKEINVLSPVWTISVTSLSGQTEIEFVLTHRHFRSLHANTKHFRTEKTSFLSIDNLVKLTDVTSNWQKKSIRNKKKIMKQKVKSTSETKSILSYSSAATVDYSSHVKDL